MSIITSKILALLNSKYDFTSTNLRFSLVFFTTLAAFIFLNFFEPFGIYHDKKYTAQDVFVELFIAMSFAFMVMIVTQFVARPFFKHYKTNIIGVIMWFFIEAVLCACVWTFLNIYIKDSEFIVVENTWHLWVENLVAYIAVMFLPYFLFIFYIHLKDKHIETKKEIKKEEREPQQLTIDIKDESGETKLLLNIDNLLYIQSADNYVEINYLENNSIQKELIRNSLKNIETTFTNSSIIRCHRSYMLNTKKIESAKKTTAGFDVKLKNITDTIIPVSRSYVSELKKYT